jgi:hypothetical protein
LLDEIKSLKNQLAEKEKERVSTVETLHLMESRCISIEANLERKTEEFDNLNVEHRNLEKEKNRLLRKAAEKDQLFFDKCNRLWELCKNCYERWGAKPEDPCWEVGEFDPFFSWLCRQYEDLPTVIQTSSDLSVMYSTRALLHLMKETNDPLYEQFYNNSFKFPSDAISQVSARTQSLCKKFFFQYWNNAGREHCFMKVKERMKQVCLLFCLNHFSLPFFRFFLFISILTA